MKARVKASGEIVEVVLNGIFYDRTDNKDRYYHHELDFNDTTDYWTRLEHQAAIAAMQAMLTSPELMQVVTSAKELLTDEFAKRVAVVADRYAHALVERLKEKEERK